MAIHGTPTQHEAKLDLQNSRRVLQFKLARCGAGVKGNHEAIEDATGNP